MLFLLDVENVIINAFIPAGAYVLSKQTIPFVKKVWIKSYLERESKNDPANKPVDIPTVESTTN